MKIRNTIIKWSFILLLLLSFFNTTKAQMCIANPMACEGCSMLKVFMGTSIWGSARNSGCYSAVCFIYKQGFGTGTISLLNSSCYGYMAFGSRLSIDYQFQIHWQPVPDFPYISWTSPMYYFHTYYNVHHSCTQGCSNL